MKGRKCAIVDHTDKSGYVPTSDTFHDYYGGELFNNNETKMIISGTQKDGSKQLTTICHGHQLTKYQQSLNGFLLSILTASFIFLVRNT